MISPKLKIIDVVSTAVEKALRLKKTVDLSKEDDRVDIAMEVCDEVIRILYPRKDYISPHDPGDEHQG
tara:strand:- start:257 stop:460 length:204 start_codon:yes stop_codon:yes gene_type:complete